MGDTALRAAPHRAPPAAQGPPAPIPSTVSDHLCIDFVNSMFMDHTGSGRVYDRLEIEEWRRWFADRCGFPPQASPDAASYRDLVTVRTFLRSLLEAGTPPATEVVAKLNRYLARSSQSWELERETGSLQLRLRWNGDGWPAVMAAVAASYATLVVSGDVHRVRVCANPDCSFMFCDDTRNASRRWCDAGICGNLMKVRRYRAHR
jgi:predicted RNA-binding Zn ribbon-like protein